MPEHMIAFGAEGPTPRADKVTLAPGLGLVNHIIVDQHFRQRGRIGRLLAALAYNPFAVGLGLDEDTAAFIGPDETMEVYGSDAITVVDTSEVEYTSMDSAHQDDDIHDQLGRSISKARQVLTGSGLIPEDHLRSYKISRTLSIVVADDAVVFSPIRLDGSGRAQRMTKAAFTIVNATSDFGEELLRMFETHWSAATPVV